MHADCGSAPAKVDRLKPVWETLPVEHQELLAYRWVDHCVRRILPSMFQRHGLRDEARSIESLPELFDPGSVVRATALLGSLVRANPQGGPLARGEAPLDVMACVFDLLATLARPLTTYEAAFLTVMTSRFAFEDDRLVAMMEKDLAGVPP